MIKQIVLPIAGVIAFIVLVGVLSQKSINISPTNTGSFASTAKIGSNTINLEVVKTEADREKGLSGRTFLAPDSGMLFVFDKMGQVHQFWMKGMLMPLDIIWIADGKITAISKSVPYPAPNTPDKELKIYSSNSPVDYVLEVNSGYSDKNGVNVGDSVTLSGV